ncbi:GntR family transcriptional regulator [Streptomyces sp. VTCC 41912]|uniref:GntR family transcriptional regulator n=1 Tax=Streptomyces sp. VTCC 41912 TaxID=3383243 RepID=UPI003896CC29
MTDRADNRPPYARIVSKYRDRIASGELKPGTLLPTIKEMARLEEVSTGTVEKALRDLRAANLIRGIHGVGTEVVGPPIPLSNGEQRQERGRLTGSSWGAGERSEGHTASVTSAPADVAVALDIRAGDDVIRRCRVYRDGHGIVAHSTSWIPLQFGQHIPGLLRGERLKGGTSLDLIAQETGRRCVVREDSTGARIATERDIELLGLQHGMVAAILVLSTRFLDAEGRPLEYGVDLGAPGRTHSSTSATTQ